MIFAFTAVFFASQITNRIPFIHLWVFIGFIAGLLIVWIIFLPSKRISELVGKIRIPFSAKLHRLSEKIINAFLAFKHKRKVLLKVLLLSVILQVNVVTYYFLISISLGLSIPYYNFFLIVPLSIFIMMLPVSINGIGLRENAFYFFLASFAVVKADAIAFAWIEYGILLLQV